MQESKKKIVIIIIAVVCVALAVAITFKTQSGGDSDVKSLTGQTWVKCQNPDCGESYQMKESEFYGYIMDHRNPNNAIDVPLLPCKKCGKASIAKAVKCEKCGEVFVEGAAGQNDYSDRCPKCKYSQQEAQLKKTE
jgi:hypothetical protein